MTRALGLMVTLVATVAVAEPDWFHLGNGQDGPLSYTSGSHTVNVYAQLTGIAAPATPGAGNVLTVDTTTGFAAGDLVMVFQANSNTAYTSGSQTAITLATAGGVGRWELARVDQVQTGTTMRLTRPLVGTFTVQRTQVIKVPEYTSVSISSGASIAAMPWNGSKGGVVAFLANDTLTLSNNGAISATAAGFRSGKALDSWDSGSGCSPESSDSTSLGAPKGEGFDFANYRDAHRGRGNLANGGGGGCVSTGGGGGANKGKGGKGADTTGGNSQPYGGLGGAALTYSLTKFLSFGGGGGAGGGTAANGAGDGGAGGGIVFIRARTLAMTSGSITANGGAGETVVSSNNNNFGAGGGGAGGSIYLRVAAGATCSTSTISANGGNGGSAPANSSHESPGGGGGGGAVLFQSNSPTSCAPTVTRGSAGTGGTTGAEPTGSGPETNVFNGNADLRSPGIAELTKPSITAPVNGSVTKNNRPTISGTGTTGLEVVAYLDDAEQDWPQTFAGPGFSFNLDTILAPLQVLPDGTHRIQVTVTEEGIHSPMSDTVEFTVDTTPPDAGVVSGPSAFTSSPSATFTLSANEPGSSFQCELDGVALPSCASSQQINNLTEVPAPHRFRVRATDIATNQGPFSADYTWTVDFTDPQAPVILVPASMGTYLGLNQAISGTVPENIDVRVFIDGSPRGTMRASNNTWTFMPDTLGIGQGSHWVQAVALDLAGNESPPSNGVVFILDTLRPAAPVLTSPGNGTTVTTNPPAMFGTAERGSTVIITLAPGGSPVEVSANDQGAWRYTPATVAENTLLTLTLSARDAAGNTSETPATYTFRVDSEEPGAPAVNAVGTNGFTNVPRPAITGTAERGSRVMVYIDDEPQPPTPAIPAGTGATGPWSFTPTENLSEGTHWVRATATDAAGNVSDLSNTVVFTLDSHPPLPPTIDTPTNGTRVSAPETVLSGEAEAGTTVTVWRVTPGGNVDEGDVTADPDHRWRFVVPRTLVEGSYSFVVEASDGVNLPVSSTTSYGFIVDRTPPETTIQSAPPPRDNVPGVDFVFSSESGARFECKFDNASGFTACNATYNPDNPLDPDDVLPNVEHTLYVRAWDTAGNVDPTPAIHKWTVDLSPPAAPVVSSPANGAFVPTTTPTLTGTAEPGARVEVFTGTTSRGSTTADGLGAWRLATSALAQGPHPLTVTQTDAVGNSHPVSSSASHSLTVDTLPPDITLTSSLTRTSSTSATFGLSSGELGVHFVCSLDGEAFVSCPASYTLSSVSVGAHVLRARAVDAAGNESTTPASHAWTVDQTAPETLIVASPPKLTNSLSGTFRFQSNEDASHISYECRWYNRLSAPGAFGPCVPSYPVTVPAGGDYRLEVQARDGANNVDSTPAEYDWTVDVRAPEQPVVTGPTGFVPSTQPSIEGDAEANSRVAVTVDGVARETVVANAAGKWTYLPSPPLAQGPHTVRVVATDAAGNPSPVSDPLSFTVDSIVPDTVIGQRPDPLWGLSSFTFTFTSPEPNVTFVCSINGTVTDPCDTPFTASRPDGNYTITITARDRAGNRDPEPAIYSWTIDATPPDTTIEAGPAELTSSPTARFTFSSDVSNPDYLCKLDTADYVDCDSPYEIEGLTTGPHVLLVKARDSVGNEDPTPDEHRWRVDTDLPDTTIVVKPERLINSLSATFQFTSTKAGAVFECSVDGASFVSCSDTVTISVFGDGAHSLEVQARDPQVGTVDPEPAIWNWNVDTMAPDTVFDDVPEVLVNTPQVTFVFSGMGGAIAFECSLDGEAFRGCTSPAPLTLEHGERTLRVRAKDEAGNVDASPVSYTLMVDLRGPDAPRLTSPASGALVSTEHPTFEGTAEPGSTVSLTMDDVTELGSVRVDSTGQWRLTPQGVIADGSHLFAAKAVDAAGNPSPSSEALVFIVDTQEPETTIVTGPDGRIRTSTASFTFGSDDPEATFECSFDGAEFSSCNREMAYPDLEEGTYTLKVRARDAAQNFDFTPESRSFKVYLGNDIRTRGGGLSCASSGGGSPAGILLGLGGLVLLAARRRRR